MKFSFAVSPQRSIDDILYISEILDYHNWGNVYCTDHLAWPSVSNIPECWTTLTAIASSTKNIGIGSLVSPPHFRHPAVMARIISTVNAISSGRLVVGLGAGWQKYENESFSLGMPEVAKTRLARLEEYADCLVGLLYKNNFQFSGEFYNLKSEAPLETKGMEIPIFLGGSSESLYSLSKKYSGVNILGNLAGVSSVIPEASNTNNFFMSAHSLIIPRINSQPLFKIPSNMKDTLAITKSGSVEELRNYIGSHAELGVSEYILIDVLYPLDRNLQEDNLCFLYSEIFDKI